GDNPETMYWVTGIDPLIDKDAGCCFDYGNAERSSNDDGNGTMEALYFGAGVVWGTGAGGKPGPWMMADLEDGLYAGWENKQDKNISTNKKLPSALVTGVLIGDTSDKNAGKGRFAIYAGDATTGTLQTMYDGIRPEKAGYVPMSKDGSIILGIGGDNSNGAGGQFYEGAISTGPAISKTTVDELQAAIVAAKYVK
ncbi:MAG: arabinofuranosidase catalytic domain-containing protein, partial [Polyangiaceae bacterium]